MASDKKQKLFIDVKQYAIFTKLFTAINVELNIKTEKVYR